MSELEPALAARLTRNDAGLIPVVVQDVETHAVLMLAWADDDALAHTLATGRATYHSRSRGERWVKGETSGNVQWVHEVRLDCDADAVLYRVRQVGPACHTGTTTCFDAERVALTVTDPQQGVPA